MKNPPRQFGRLWDATKRNSLSSLLSEAVRVVSAFLYICSASVFAGEAENESAPPPSSAAPSNPEVQLTPEQGKANYDRFITGDWGGLRTQLHNWGVDVNLSYYSEMAGNIHGGKDNFSGYPKGLGESWAYADQALFGVDLNFQKMIGWAGGSFEAYFTKRDGHSLGEYTNPAPLQQYQQIYGRGQTWRITNLWFKQEFGEDLVEWKVGLIPIGEEFGNFYSYPFENLTFCSGTPGNVAGYSQFNWPVSQWATDLRINVTKSWAVKVGLFAFNDYWISNNYYLRIDNPGGTSGAIVPVEISWNPKLPIFGKDLPGSWNFTIWGNTNNKETTGAAKSWLGSATKVAPGLLGPSQLTGDYGYAVSIWQQVTAPDPNRPKTGLTLFASNTWVDPRTSFQNLQAFAGAYYWGLWSKRPYDTCGLAWGYNRVAGNVQNAQRQYIAAHPNSGFGVQSNEFVGEVFYSFDVYHGLNIQPDLQYIINPGGYTRATNQVIFGVQLNAPL